MTIIYIFSASFLIMLTSVSGVFFLQKKYKNFLDKNLVYLISFSAGIFLVVSGHLILESFEALDSFLMTGLFVLLGFFLVWLLERIFPEIHHHHDECCEGHKKTGRKVILGDGIHNIADGIILATAFMVSLPVGLLLTASIFIHELLQEISEFFILKQAGYSTKKAILINFFISGTILIGVLIGLLLSGLGFLSGIILAISAGFFLNLVFDDLLPHHHKTKNTKDFLKHLGILALGLVFMFVIFSILPQHQI